MKKDERSPWSHWSTYVAGIALLVMTFIVAINALARYFFNAPFAWAEELATSMFVWLIFIGAVACYQEKMHIGIDCFVGMLPIKWQRIMEVVVDVILLLANIYLTYLSGYLTMTAWSKLTPSMRVPYSFIDVAAAIGFAAMAYEALRFLVKDIRKVSQPEDEAEEKGGE